MSTRFFSPALFRFLRDLKANNNPEWFQTHKAQFEVEVREPMLAFILAFGAPLAEVNRHFEANPARSGGSMFRINRDIRFSHDKSPYKTNVGAQFRHRACPREVHSPGFYLHLEPRHCFMFAGLWHPDPATLKRVRDRIVAHPRQWTALAGQGLQVEGDALVRVPQGYDPAHPQADALRLKEYYTATPLTEGQVCSGEFLDLFAEHCRSQAPLVRFLSQALDLPW